MAPSDEAGGQYMGVNLSHITHDRILGVGMGCGVWGKASNFGELCIKRSLFEKNIVDE
jgi:hypothetical protein